jgi:hypothetical protein
MSKSQQEKKFRIVHKYDGINRHRVYVQERIGWWIFKWWTHHNNENSRYNIDHNFRTVEEAKDYIIKYRCDKAVPKFKEIIYV